MHNLQLIQSKASRFKRPTHIAKKLDLLVDLSKEMNKTNFSRYSFLFIQHFCHAFPARLDLMLENGLDKKRTWFLDIPYSTNVKVRNRIADTFVQRVPTSYSNPFGHYCADQQNRLATVVDSIIENGNENQLVVVDDGAYFARYLNRLLKSEPAKANLFSGIRLVEQTTRGNTFLQCTEGKKTLHDLKIHAVSVAATKTKTEFEAPFIGVAIADALVGKLKQKNMAPKRALVIGFGNVGRAAAFALRLNYPDVKIEVIEIAPEKIAQARAWKFKVHKELPRSNCDYTYDLIIGCTGHCNFGPANKHILADNALLASGSSAAVEFDRKNFVDQADEQKDDDFAVLTSREKTLDLHTDIAFTHTSGKTFTILNAGFPVNFQGNLGMIPTKLIEPTHCLLHAATIEAMDTSRVGFCGLSEEWDNWIYERAKNYICD